MIKAEWLQSVYEGSDFCRTTTTEGVSSPAEPKGLQKNRDWASSPGPGTGLRPQNQA